MLPLNPKHLFLGTPVRILGTFFVLLGIILAGTALVWVMFFGGPSGSPKTFGLPSNTWDYEYWAKVTKEKGVKEALEELSSASAGGSEFDCHQQSHEVGRTGYDLFGTEVFGMCTEVCHSGCYHGAMQKFIPEIGVENVAQVIPEVCEKNKTSQFTYFECLHGIGHGVTMFQTYDLPQALSTCDRLPDSYSRESCYGGAFMENIVGDPTHGTGAVEKEWLSSTDPHFPCNAVDEKYGYQCYLMQTSQMLNIFGGDFGKVAEACLSATERFVPTCFVSYGRDVAGRVLRDPGKIKELCDKVDPQWFEACIQGAENVVIDFWGSGLTDQAAELCKLLDDDDKEYCYKLWGSRLNDLFPYDLQKEKACAYAESEYYRGVCEKSAGVD